MRGRLVVGNWKMHGELAATARLLQALKAALTPVEGCAFAVCVPFPYLAQAAEALRGSALAWGAQDLSEHDAGAFTGEVSGNMLRDFACRYAIVGHSERRTLHGETDRTAGAKLGAALRSGLTPIVCVGETLAERERGDTEAVLARQIDALLQAQGVGALARSLLAYEPVWAIGTGHTATPDQAQRAHAFIRGRIAAADAAIAADLSVLYGGSVKSSNARELFSMPDVDGGLIGGASLAAGDFLAICAALSQR
ncbi:MAG: triose-phosphate isomerase [Burkholderiales bacterium]|nr:triose-phosphate isomerase [Burkholderiales bacterium]